MKSIELTKEQQASVDFDAGDLLIRGVAGSGKSVVLMSRAVKFNKKAIEEGRHIQIGLFSYTKTLVRFIEETIRSVAVSPNMIKVQTVDSYCWALYTNMTGLRPQLAKDWERKELVDTAIRKHQKKSGHSHRFYNVETDFWVDEFLWMKQRHFSTASDYIAGERIGRGRKVRILKNDKAMVYELFEDYCDLLKGRELLDWEDMYSYVLEHSADIPDNIRFDEVLIDEAQDLSFIKLKFARLLARTRITVAADKAQKIYKTAFSWKDLGIDIRGRSSKTLSKTFRSTKEIVQLAESLLEANRILQTDKAEYTEAVLPTRSGSKPYVLSCANSAEEGATLCQLIRSLSAKRESVVILYKTWSEERILAEWLEKGFIAYEKATQNSKWSVNGSGVKLCTFHSAKGVEFDHVIIPLFNASVMPKPELLAGLDEEQTKEALILERSILYVGMTRARYSLTFTYSGTYSRFLEEFEPDFYEYTTAKGKALEKPERRSVSEEQGEEVKI